MADVRFIDMPPEFDPERPRRMGFTYGDIKKITRGLNGPLIAGQSVPGADRSVWVRLWSLDPDAVSTVAYWGLQRFDPDIKTEKVDDLIYRYNVYTEDPYALIGLIVKALQIGGHLPKDQDKPVEAKDKDPLGRRATTETIPSP